MIFKKPLIHPFVVLPVWLALTAGNVFALADIGLITVDELKARLDRNDPILIIDVRATDDYIGADARILNAIHIRSRRLQARLTVPPLKDVPRDRDIVIYCACPNEETSIRGARILLAAGFNRVHVLKGGWRAWLAAGGAVEQKPRD